MRALQVLTPCIFATTLSIGNTFSPEVCEDCRGETRRGMQSGDEATSLLQFRQELSERSAQNAQEVGVPVFKINLDDPPRKRLQEVAQYYRKELIAQQGPMQNVINQLCDAETGAQWWSHSSVHQYPEYLEELEGVVDAVNHSAVNLESLILTTMLYEMGTPARNFAVIAVDSNGTVIHGRNMDSSLPFTMPDGTQKNWADLTHQVHYYKGNKSLYISTQWPVAGGITTAMRFDGWSIQHSARNAKNDWHLNLAAAQKGGIQSAFAIRQIMETTPDFETAVKRIHAIKFMAPAYFIMAGAKPWEGAILSVDRMGLHERDTPAIQFLNESRSKMVEREVGPPEHLWYVAHANDDPGSVGEDSRLPVAKALLDNLEGGGRKWINQNNMMQLMHSPPLSAADTAFSNVMIPATGSYKTALPTQAPPALPLSAALFAAKSHADMEWRVIKTGAEATTGLLKAAKTVKSIGQDLWR